MNKEKPEPAAEPQGPPFPSAQNLTNKRVNIASKAVDQCTKLWDAIVALQELQLEAAQAGNFLDDDFVGTSLTQLTGFMVGLMLTTVTPGIVTFMTAQLPGNGPIPRDILLQMRS